MKHFIASTTILIVFIALLTVQCKQEPDPIIEEENVLAFIPLSQAELDIIPYALNDTFTFVNAAGDKEFFKVRSYNIYTSRAYVGGGTYTPEGSYDFEHLIIEIKSQDSTRISLRLSTNYPRPATSISADKNDFSIGLHPWNDTNIVTPMFNEYNVFRSFIDTSTFHYDMDGNQIVFHNSITLNNTTFQSVYTLERPRNSNNLHPRTLYYNKTEGLIGIKMNTGDIWSLIK